MATVQDPSNTAGSLIAASQVSGTSVYSLDGERLGSVQDVLMEKVSGRATYAILSFGGFLGLGDRHHPLPWSMLHYDEQLGGYVVNVSREQLEAAPSYAPGEAVAIQDEVWGRRLHDYYGAIPYWTPTV